MTSMSFDFQFEEWLADSLRNIKSSALFPHRSTGFSSETPTSASISFTSGGHSIASHQQSTSSGDFFGASGDFSTTSGDFFGTSGDFSTTSGDFFGTSGDFLATSGDFFGTSGDFLTTSGDFFGTSGDFSTTSGDRFVTSAAFTAFDLATASETASRMGDGQHSARKKKSTDKTNKSYYYALTYDEEDSGSVDETGNDVDNIRNRVANILAETELASAAADGVPSIDGRLDFNDNLFGADGSLRNSRSLDFDLSDDDFQSVESRSDAGKPDVDTGSVDEDFVQITRPEAEAREGHASPGSGDDVVGFSSGQGSSPRTSGSGRPSGSSPLAVVYVKQKATTELYDGNFIDDDILQPQEERAIARDAILHQDFLPIPVEEMTLEIDEEDDGIPDTGSGIDPIMFRKTSDRWCARHRKLVIGVLVGSSLLVAAGLAIIIYFSVQAAR